MSLTKVAGKSGAAVVTTNRYPAVKGEIVRISCEVRGRGSVVVGLDHYAKGGALEQIKASPFDPNFESGRTMAAA